MVYVHIAAISPNSLYLSEILEINMFIRVIALAVCCPSLLTAQTPDLGQPISWFDALLRGLDFGQFTPINLIFLVVGVLITLALEWFYLKIRRNLFKLNPRSASRSLGLIDFGKFRGHKLLTLGEGGAGKSSLLKAMSHGAAGRSDIKTGKADFATFAMALGVSSANPKGSGLVISTVDYNGQRPGSVTGLMDQLTRKHSQPVTAVILVVDVVAPPESADEPIRIQRQEVDQMRINQQTIAWGGNSLELIKGELKSGGPKSFILFINAVDAVQKYAYVLGRPLEETDRAEIMAHFEDFRSHLSKIWRDSSVKTIVGSVNSSHTIAELRNVLEEDAQNGGAG